MNQRQIDILSLIINEYIETAMPVGSELLVDKHNLDLSPATVRNEMAQLENDEYILQPHTSAGRVPSDKGYRFYVDYLMTLNGLSKKEQEKLKEGVSESQEQAERLVHSLAKTIAGLSDSLVISGILDTKDFYEEAGVHSFLEQYGFDDAEDIQGVLSDLSYIDKNIWSMTDLLEHETKIYIGKENPLPPIKKYSTIVSQYRLPGEQKGFLILVGPTRMNYEKNVSLVEYVIEYLD